VPELDATAALGALDEDGDAGEATDPTPDAGAGRAGDVDAGDARDGGTSRPSSILDALKQTDPDPPLDEVESPFDPERGGRRRIARGVRKMLGVEGTPAGFDLVVGVLEELDSLDLEDVAPDQEEDDDAPAFAGEDSLA
jgi:hypothetical protein